MKAAENEDFEEAERLNHKISQTKLLILSKQHLSKNNEDDLAGIENRKGDKQLELRNLIAKSQVKL